MVIAKRQLHQQELIAMEQNWAMLGERERR
jgi:hypothetical protein